MPYGGNDWLEITKEEIIEPSLPICDPHHHYWDLRTQRIPYGRYLLHELLDDINDHNVTSTVFIEARAMYSADLEESSKPVGEVEFVEGLSAASSSGIYGKSRASASDFVIIKSTFFIRLIIRFILLEWLPARK